MVTDRHKSEIPMFHVLLVFKPPNFQRDNFGPILPKKKTLVSNFAKQMQERWRVFKKEFEPQTLIDEMVKLKRLPIYKNKKIA